VKRPEDSNVTDPMIEVTERPIAGVVTRPGFGSQDAADSLVEAAFAEFADRLTAFAMASVRDRDVADDLVAEAFLRLLNESRSGRRPDHVGGWLYRVIGNLIVSRGRRQSVARRFLPRLRGPDDDAEPPEALVVRRETNDQTVRALQRLPEDARVALLLAAQGYDMVTIGAAIGRSASATRTYVCRSRVRLRDFIAEADTYPPTEGRP
jgi:RNA polymerase sigma-70 factor, ECF subfamily